MNMRRTSPAVTIALSTVLFAFAIIVVSSWPRAMSEAGPSVAASAACADIKSHISITGKAAFAEDLTSGAVLFEKNADAQLPLASLTKLTTLATASRILSPDDTVTFTAEAMRPEADVGDLGLREGEQWRAEDLMDYTLMVSANRGAHALALAAAGKKGESIDDFVRDMDATARSFGATETYFASDTGLDISSTTASAYGSPRDIAAILSGIVKDDPRLVSETTNASGTFVSESGLTHEAKNTSDVAATLPGAVAQKTGYTDLAGGNLAVEYEPIPGRPVVAVVLGSTEDGRDADMRALIDASSAALTRAIVCKTSAELNGP